ncbi:cache domain-containing protein [Ktedonospora formicarum]|uniref:Cache domain-containing protein n=1 Tax=Ktedonospora formicarum TaxID=2778364 RepID=A0A8J3IBP3_9CHLR|nr:cache domain-containing protein [Ktedonospora formicarum]GHO51008.1 hypothetical protein KSX_91710 [Ktedonospora formicarum]
MSQMRKEIPLALKKRRFSLSVYIPLLLALCAIIPLLITIGSIEIFLRPALISQISTDMEKSTQTHMQLVDTYLSERLNDVKTLSETAAIKDQLKNPQADSTNVRNILLSIQHRDIANYISVSLLTSRGNNVISYPAPPSSHGKKYLIVPGAQQALKQSGHVYVSDVFYDLTSNIASVDLYARVVDNNSQILGYVRASLSLRRIWEPVDSEQESGNSSYATILDQNGVRIAYTNPDLSGFTRSPFLFKAIAPLSTEIKNQIQNENLYGQDTNAVTTEADPELASFQNNGKQGDIGQINPAGQQQAYAVTRYTSSVVPWTYVLFRPLNAVTGLADQQLISIFIIVTLVLVAVLGIGVVVGRNLALPILRSVILLRESNVNLKTLADEESVVAAEQTWMVEASQVALKSVQYYTNSTSIAAQRVNQLTRELVRDIPTLNRERLQKVLGEIAEAASYIERSVKHQKTMNDKLETSLRVTTQVTEQLTRGATSTNEAASQMEYIVKQLTSVVGEK